MENLDVARAFDEIADLLEIKGANPFRVRAYRNAARVIGALPQSVASMLKDDGRALEELPGVGEDLANKIVELAGKGRLRFLDDLRKEVPRTLLDVLHVKGLGPKRTRKLWKDLRVKSLGDLEKVARRGRLADLEGFGAKTQAKVLEGIAELRARAGRVRLAEADTYALPLLEYLRGAKGLADLEIAGSYRRRRETVGDLDILATTAKGSDVMERFVHYPEVESVVARGRTKSSVRLRSGLQVDLRLVDRKSYGAALQYFTGSKAHNVKIRGLAQKRGLKINEYGVFRKDKLVAGRTEAEVYAAVKLPLIPPELREDRGEIEAAAEGKLPDLLEPGDIRGDLQMHTTRSDGRDKLEDMVKACRKRGYAYMAVTDHSPTVRIAGGLKPADFARQYAEIDRLQRRVKGIRILKSAEVEILEDGTLDLPDATLARMDVVLATVHTKMEMPRKEMTRRIVTALRNSPVQILGHPTGRLLNRREPYAVDMEEVVAVAREEGVLLELDSHPERMDLNDVHLRLARDAGAKVVISTDAHAVEDLEFMRYGVEQARRGWLSKADVANTLPLGRFLKLLRRR